MLKLPKNLATPKKCGKIEETPFLNSFKVSDSESEVRILIKILVLKLSKLMTLFVRNCSQVMLQLLVLFREKGNVEFLLGFCSWYRTTSQKKDVIK